MNDKLRIALIPAYEPEPQLIKLLENIREQGLCAIVIDDGSGAGFSNIFQGASGFRGFSSALVPVLLDIEGDRYEYEINVLLEFARREMRIEEIEIPTIYFANNSGSHFNTLKDSLRIYKQIIKYSASSFVSFLLDYALYSLLAVMTAGLGSASLTVSNVVARLVSAGVNFIINRKLVFKSEKSLWKSSLQYFSLAAVILAGNTLLLNQFVTNLGMNRFAAKMITEVFFFTLSWMIQRFLIFRKREVHIEIEHS
ncbi:MAG: GtrA family protein [Anaerotignum sp.]|nr:GtrA family protein [Anaerotignum sp.]